MTTASPKPPRRPQKRRRWQALAGVLLVCAVLPVVILVAMIGQEISAPEWVRTRITSQFEKVVPDSRAQVENVTITLGRDLHPRVRLSHVQLVSKDLRPILRLREVTGLLSPRGVLFERSLLLQDIAIDGARLDLRRDKHGSVTLSFGAGAELAQVSGLAALLDQTDDLLARPSLTAMERISVTGLIVQYDDAHAKRSWTVDGGAVDIDLRGQRRSLVGDFSLLSGGAGVTRLKVGYQSREGVAVSDISVDVDRALASDLATQTPALAWLSAVNAPVSGSLRTRLDANADLGPLAMSIEIAEGSVQPNERTEPVDFERIKAYLTYDPVDASITFDTFDVRADDITIRGAGHAWLTQPLAGGPDALTAQFALEPAELPVSANYPQGLSIPASQIDLQMKFTPFQVDLGQLVTTEADSKLIVSGKATAGPNGWDVSGDVTVDRIASERVFELWPRGWRKEDRARAVAAWQGGTLTEINGAFRKSAGLKPVWTTQWSFDSVTLATMARAPQVVRASGAVTLDDDLMTVALDRGRMPIGQTGALDLAGSQMTVPVGANVGPAALQLAVKGPIPAAVAVVARVHKANPALRNINGRVDLDVTLNLAPALGALEYDVSGHLLDVNTGQLVPNRPFTSNRLAFSADAGGVRINGQVQHQGVESTIEYRNPTQGTARLIARLPLSPQTTDVFDIPLPQGVIAGQASARIDVTLPKGKPPDYVVTSDLRGLAVSVPSIGWRKPAQSTARLRVQGTLEEQPTVDALAIEASDLVLQGRLDFNRDGALRVIQLDDLRVGGWFNGPVTLTSQGPQRPMEIETQGGSIDLRKLATGGGSDAGAPMTLVLDRVQVTDRIALTEFRGTVQSVRGMLGEFSARLNDGPRIAGSLVPANGQTAVRIKSNDAGSVLRAAGLIETAFGGALDLILRPTAQSGAFDGTLRITSVRLRDAPAIAALLDAVSVVGLLTQLDGNGIAFEEVDARFRLMPDRVVVTQSSAVGPGLGVSLDGVYDLRAGRMDFQGVVSPFYLLNSVGSFLTRKGEGLIGFNFNLRGTSEQPAVDVNPLSAFTPGMFREIFRRPAPQVTQ